MFLLLDREQMCIRYRHPNQNVLNSLMAIEFTNTSVVCMGDTEHESFGLFTDYELKMLYLNLCGQKYVGYSRIILVNALIQMITTLEPDQLNGFELALQAGHIHNGDLGFYRYVPGRNTPTPQEEVYIPKARTSVAGYTPAPVSTPAQQTPPAQHTQAAGVPAHREQVPVSAEAPKEGSKTGRVWQIAEALLRTALEENEQYGRTLDVKHLRKCIVSQCESEGINTNTASVQYSKWRNTKSF